MPSSARDGNVEIVGGRNLALTPNHPGSVSSTMCKSVRWARSLRRLMCKSGIPNWTESQAIPKPSRVEYGTNVNMNMNMGHVIIYMNMGQMVKCATAASVDAALPVRRR